MTRVYKTALLPYSAQEIFTLVNDISAYPKFLPWCKTVTIHSHTESEIVATIKMGGAGMEKTFTTSNVIKPYEWIEMRLLEGPFNHLKGYWNFHPLGENGCKVSLNMEFEITNPLLRLSLGPVFNKIVNNLVDAFVERANSLHQKHLSNE